MKKNFIRNLLLCIIGVTGFVCCNERVEAITIKILDEPKPVIPYGGSYDETGLPEPPYKMVTIDGGNRYSGAKFEGYCTHYAWSAPSSKDSNNIGTPDKKRDLSPMEQIGVGNIIAWSTTVYDFCEKDIKYSPCNMQFYVAQEIAINLYLSYTHGDDLERFDGENIQNKILLRNYDGQEDLHLILRGKDNDTIYGSPGRYKIVHSASEVYSYLKECQNNGKCDLTKHQDLVLKLYERALNATTWQQHEVEPAVWFEDDVKQFEYNSTSKNFEATFEVRSNFISTGLDIQFSLGNDKWMIPSVAKKSGISYEVVLSEPTINDFTRRKIKVSISEKAFESIENLNKIGIKIGFSNSNVAHSYWFQEGKQPLAIVLDEYGNYSSIQREVTKYATIGYSCYKYEHSCNVPQCTNDQSSATCDSKTTPYISKTPCGNETKKDGIKTFDVIEGVCSLYCTESATVSYPGNANPVAFPNNLVWPSTVNGPYPLATHAKLTCMLEMNDGSPVTEACKNQLNSNYNAYKYNNGSGAILKYQVPELIEATHPWVGPSLYKVTNLQQKCNSSTVLKEDGVTVEIVDNCSYTLPSNFNSAISKKTLEYVKSYKIEKNSAIKDEILLKNGGVIPIGEQSWHEELTSTAFQTKYGLAPRIPLGNGNQFGNTLNDKDYTCNYKITTDVEGRFCDCPAGTKFAGLDLYPTIEAYNKLNAKPINCLEAQNEFCNEYPPPPLKITCPPGSDNYPEELSEDCAKNPVCVLDTCYDKPDNPDEPDGIPKTCTKINYDLTTQEQDITACLNDKDLVSCINEYCPPLACPPGTVRSGEALGDKYNSCIYGGETSDNCLQIVCNDECPPGDSNCNYVCPKDSCKPNMNIDNCISFNRGAGKTLAEALKLCYDNECSCGNTKIIYRTISLENPFPSMDADLSLNNAPALGTFNDTVRGRYPGTNWNGITVVKDKILNNRGYDGSSIYKEAEPLYVINLDAASIKKIRAYNKTQNKNDNGYADFTLDCTEGAYCISTFLHNKLGEFNVSLGGTCKDASNKIGFNTCYKTK